MKYVTAMSGIIVATGTVLEASGLDGRLHTAIVAAGAVALGAPLLALVFSHMDDRDPKHMFTKGDPDVRNPS